MASSKKNKFSPKTKLSSAKRVVVDDSDDDDDKDDSFDDSISDVKNREDESDIDNDSDNDNYDDGEDHEDEDGDEDDNSDDDDDGEDHEDEDGDEDDNGEDDDDDCDDNQLRIEKMELSQPIKVRKGSHVVQLKINGRETTLPGNINFNGHRSGNKITNNNNNINNKYNDNNNNTDNNTNKYNTTISKNNNSTYHLSSSWSRDVPPILLHCRDYNLNNVITSSLEVQTSNRSSMPDPIIYITNIDNNNRKHKNTNILPHNNKNLHFCATDTNRLKTKTGFEPVAARPNVNTTKSEKLKFDFQKCSSFSMELKEQFKASRNCHSANPIMNFDQSERKRLKRNLCCVCFSVFLFNLVIGMSMILMTTYVVYYRARNERSTSEVEILKYGLRMKMRQNRTTDDGNSKWRTISSWVEDDPEIMNKTFESSNIFIDTVQYSTTTGHFSVQLDGFYHIFSRIYCKPTDELIKINLKLLPGEQAIKAKQSPLSCNGKGGVKVCHSSTLTLFTRLMAGESFFIETTNSIADNIDSWLFVHIL